MKFRSKFEERVAKDLTERKVDFFYESDRLSYIRKQTYLTDFRLPNGIFIETKGYWPSHERTKMKLVRESHPEVDIRFVFQYNNKLNKNSKTTYGEWCDKNNFIWSVGEISQEWLDEKQCFRCKVFKNKEDFPKNKSAKEGIHCWCKKCHNARGKQSYKENPGIWRNSHLLRTYGITLKEFNEMIDLQENKCLGCSTPFVKREGLSGGSPAVDHCHETGEIRGILCQNCNRALGMVKDLISTLEGLIAYLKRNKKKEK